MNVKNKVILGTTLGLLVGGGITYFFTHNDLVKKSEEIVPSHSIASSSFSSSKDDFDRFFNDSFNDDFFSSDFSPFEQMKKMRQNMRKLLENPEKGMEGHRFFDDWYESKFGGSIFDIEQREDENYIYYDIKLEGLDLDKDGLKVNVVDNMLKISGEIMKTQEHNTANGITKSQFQQSFQRSFPVPSGVDSEKVKFETESDRLIVKFPKIKEGMI